MSQVTKSLLFLLALVAVGAGLGLYAYFGVQKTDEAAAAKKEHDEKLFTATAPGEKADAGAADVRFTSLSITSSKGETTTLERAESGPGGGEWRLTSPLKSPADKFTVDQVLSQLQTARLKTLVEEKPTAQDLEKFGLTPPRFTVSAVAYLPDSQGKGADDPARRREVALEGGIENPFDGSVYLRRKGTSAVYAAEGGVRIAFDKSTFDLRDKEVLGFDEPKVQRLEVKGANQYVLERDASSAWRLTQPASLPADPTTVTTMFSALRNERALAFPRDTSEERSRLGFDKPIAQATVTSEGGSTVKLALAQLKLADGTDKFHLLREGPEGTLLAEVPAGARQFDRPMGELRDKTVLKFKREDVARVRFKPAGEGAAIVVARALAADGGPSEEWTVVEPQKGPAKKWKLSSVLWALGSLRAAQFGDEKPKDWSRYGLDAKARTVVLEDASGRPLATLAIGKDVPEKPNMAYVRGSAEQVLEVDTSRFSELPATVEDVLEAAPAADAGAPPAH